MLLNCIGEDSWESLLQQGDQTSQPQIFIGRTDAKASVLSATWCEELTYWKRPICQERLKAGGEGGDREWDGWMASLTQWTWVWASSGRWWRTGKPQVLQSMGQSHTRLREWTTTICFFPVTKTRLWKREFKVMMRDGGDISVCKVGGPAPRAPRLPGGITRRGETWRLDKKNLCWN